MKIKIDGGGKRDKEESGGHDAAGAAEGLERNLREREAEERVWEQQQRGDVGAQTVDLHPSAANSESGLPHNPMDTETLIEPADAPAGAETGSHKSGDLDADSRAAARSAANAEETVRAATEHDEKFLRLAADFENYKRQVNRREAEVRDRATRSVLEDLLPVIDNFDRALEAARSASDVESLRIGVEFIAQQLRDALKNHGVDSVDSVGKPFDPMQHDALEEVANSGKPEGTVVEEVQRGYSYRGQVLRPSRVRVAGKGK